MRLIGLALTFIPLLLMGQNPIHILHYSETSGYDHQTRSNSLAMFQQFPFTLNTFIINDVDGSEFSSLNNLLQYDLIIFSNTSGSAILDSTQRSHFEAYIAQGGSILGIHAASDTYRHSSSNGGPKGVWDFYAETLGGSVQQSPNHVSGTPVYDISKTTAHLSTSQLPDPWSKAEEYYYWENGYLDSSINVLLKVETTVGPNGLVNSYDSSRAVSWVKQLNSGSRIFYTSLGHANSNYTSDPLFKDHIYDATRWCLGFTSSIEEQTIGATQLYPNPTENKVFFQFGQERERAHYKVYDHKAELIAEGSLSKTKNYISLKQLPPGVYLIDLRDSKRAIGTYKILKK